MRTEAASDIVFITGTTAAVVLYLLSAVDSTIRH